MYCGEIIFLFLVEALEEAFAASREEQGNESLISLQAAAHGGPSAICLTEKDEMPTATAATNEVPPL